MVTLLDLNRKFFFISTDSDNHKAATPSDMNYDDLIDLKVLTDYCFSYYSSLGEDSQSLHFSPYRKVKMLNENYLGKINEEEASYVKQISFLKL